MLQELSRPVEPAKQPDYLEDAIPAEPGLDRDIADPVIVLVLGWYQARQEYLDQSRNVERLARRIPDWIREWKGIYVGHSGGTENEDEALHARSETQLNQHFERHARAAAGRDARNRIEKRRRLAAAELRLTLAAEKGAYRAAGLPFDRDTEPEFWAPLRRRIEELERSIERTPARSGAGLAAKWRHTADCLRETDGETGATGHVHRMMRVLAEDLERLGLDTLPS